MRKKRVQTRVRVAGALTVLFLLLIVLVKFVDVQAIGPLRSNIGCAGLNGYWAEHFPLNPFWYKLTSLLGVVAVLLALGFAALGAFQLLSRRSLRRVDRDMIMLGCAYAVTVLFYLFFELVVISYRPVVLEEGLEASFPSSHTMLAVVIYGTAILQVRRRLEPDACRTAVTILAGLMALTVFGRLICGVHWFTDVVGGILLGGAIVAGYDAALVSIRRKRPK